MGIHWEQSRQWGARDGKATTSLSTAPVSQMPKWKEVMKAYKHDATNPSELAVGLGALGPSDNTKNKKLGGKGND